MNRASPGILGPVRKNETNAPGGGASDRCRPFVSVRVGPVGLPRRRAGRGHRRGLLCTQCFRARAYRQHDKDHDGVCSSQRTALRMPLSPCRRRQSGSKALRSISRRGSSSRSALCSTACCCTPGNDAAVALALAHSGSVGAFVEAMNGRARELGLRDTHFYEPERSGARRSTIPRRSTLRA